MFRKVLIACLLALVSSASFSQEPVSWLGRYKLWLSGDAEWHQNALEIATLNGDEVDGTLEVDLGIGPEGRAPQADEILHKIPFKAKRQAEGQPYVAEVLVGSVQPKVYRFELYPIEPGKSWSGVALLGNRRTGVLLRRD